MASEICFNIILGPWGTNSEFKSINKEIDLLTLEAG